MKHAVLLAVLAATPAFAPALAQQDKPLCVDASRDGRYNARPLSLHTVLARNAFGPDRRAVKLDTTCIHVDRAAFISLHSFSQCIAVGDDVVASVPGGRREICRVTHVTPAAQNYADAKYSYN
ncbi:MAG TPA: hypothetical protein VHC39_16645 [Rhizomicrobium sp.]|nr:hypothetical protein [Rhizomicrobium sp.]